MRAPSSTEADLRDAGDDHDRATTQRPSKCAREVRAHAHRHEVDRREEAECEVRDGVVRFVALLLDAPERGAHQERAEERVHSEPLRHEARHQHRDGDGRDEGGRPGDARSQPMEHGRSQVAPGRDHDDEKEEDEHDAAAELAGAGRALGSDLSEDDRKERPVHEVVHDRRRHDERAEFLV
jgi:hypothetical protein